MARPPATDRENRYEPSHLDGAPAAGRDRAAAAPAARSGADRGRIRRLPRRAADAAVARLRVEDLRRRQPQRESRSLLPARRRTAVAQRAAAAAPAARA